MKPDPSSQRELGDGYRYVALGITFGLGIVLFMGAGFALDKWLGTVPWGTMIGTMVGAALSFINVYTKLELERRERMKPRDERNG